MSTSQTERLQSILDFLQVAGGLKTIERATYLPDLDRHENDAEHTFHMALFALLLMPETELDVDRARVYELILVHDLVEIIAGDTPAYDVQARLDAKEREARAAEELFAALPADVGARLHATWREFEDGDTPEAEFARAMDRLQGFAQNVFSDGRNWRERGVTEAMTRDRNRPIMALDDALRTAAELLYARAHAKRMWERNVG
jgi:5'-deoxynucleotidase YfbR-like HD superfamily hydrolase